MKKLLFVIPLFLLCGCSGLAGIDQTGSKTTTYYNDNGKIEKQVQEEKPIFDTQSMYQETIRSVSTDEKDRVIGQARSIQETCTKNIKLQKDATAIALLTIMCADKIAAIPGITPELLASIQRSKSGYEVAGEVAGKAIDGSIIGMGIHGAANLVRAVAQEAGDRTSIDVSGDSNTVAMDKREIVTEIHANTTGDNSAPVVNTSPTTGCESGNCGEPTESLPPGAPPKPESCGSGGFWNGTRWQLTPTCSCDSHAAGHC